MRHLHFGAGSFGLGFVGWLSSRLGLELYICNRANSETGALSNENVILARDLAYDVVYVTGERDTVQLNKFINLTDASDLASLVEVIKNPQTRLLTASLGKKSAYSVIAPIIVEGLLSRSVIEAAPLYVLACENEIQSSDLRQAVVDAAGPEHIENIETLCRFIPCVVDRVCTRPAIEADRLVVRAERYGRLSLGPDVDLSFFQGRLSEVDRTNQVVKIEPNFELATMKKKWLLNGPHLLLAVNAIFQDRLAFHRFARENRELTQEILQEFAIGLFYICVDGGGYSTEELERLDLDLREDVRVIQERFEREPDDAHRIAKRFVRPSTPNPDAMTHFFANMRYKILEPAAAIHRHEGQLPNRISLTLLRLIELIADRRFVE